MKRVLLGLFLIVIIFSISQSISSKSNLSSVQVTKNLTSMPLSFTENQGQWDEKIKFRANAGGATMWFASDGAYYQFTRTIESAPISVEDKQYGMPDDIIDREPDSIETMMIKANFVGANANPQMVGMDMIDYKCNYFIGNDESKWATDIPNYTAVLYEKVYDGIDLKYYGNGSQMEYDFIVEPGADFSQIKIQYEGAESISVNSDGELVVKTMWGEVVEQKPVIYQIENGNRIAIDGKYNLQSNRLFSFELDSYNPTLPLVIDPVLSYSTYIGGFSNDIANGIAIDNSGAIYISGSTRSIDFPTLNGYSETIQGSDDLFVSKMNSSGDNLIYSTFIGGSNNDYCYSIAVDSLGTSYIVGSTNSSDFPLVNEYLSDRVGKDAFISILNNTGNNLVYSTYLGGSGEDIGWEIAVDSPGIAYIIGETNSTNFPTTAPYQGSNQGGNDVFITKISGYGQNINYSTYLGGSGEDVGKSIVIDGTGAAYLTGYTESTNFPMLNQYQGLNQGGIDAFITKLSSSGNSLVYSTYLGGSSNSFGADGDDIANGITIDNFGAVYITGTTSSIDFPTNNPFQATKQSFFIDAFVSKLNSSGSSLEYSTYLGGEDYDYGYSIEVDTFGIAYVTGSTRSSSFPTVNPYQELKQGLEFDVFVTKLNSVGNDLDFSTYLGGVARDEAFSIAIDSIGGIYLTGSTNSTDFPLLNPFQGILQGGESDAFVTKFNPDIPPSCCLGIRGNVDGDVTDGVDISDLVFLVAYMFQGGTEPLCLDEANIDGSGGIDISDLVALVAFMFQGGAAPANCP